MSEILATIGLLGMGYMMTNKKQPESKETFMNNSLAQVIDAEKIEKEAAQKNNAKTKHIPSLESPYKPNATVPGLKKGQVVSMLSGETITEKEFKTRNDGKILEPFFGKSVTQSTKDLNIPNRMLEANGISQFDCKKKETKPLFAPTANLTYVNGTPAMDQSMIDRQYITPKRQGELPFEKVRVAPGLGQNYGTEGAGGFQQYETNELIKPKSVDDLRAKSNPKLTYSGRVVSGKRINGNRGKVGVVNKHLPETFYENSPERYFKTTGAVLKTKSDEQFIVNNTNRQNSRFFVGGAKTSTEKEQQKQEYKKSHRNNYKGPDVANPHAKNSWNALGQNYGKDGYKAYPNERDLTQKRTNKLNVSSFVKSLMTPLQDLVRTTRKENFVGNNRPEGNMNAAMPKRQTVYDPNDIARTTIKETTIDNKHIGGYSGTDRKQKVSKYDTLPKNTLRQTLDQPDYGGNIVPDGPKKLQTFNKANPPKTTVKETLVEETRDGFLNGGYKKGGYMVDPAEAPNTSRQFMSNHEYIGGGESKNKGATTYDSSYNARLNLNKEQLAKGRSPTKESTKVSNGTDKVNILHKKQMTAVSYPKINKAPEHVNTASEVGINLSHFKDQLSNDLGTKRIEKEVLDSLKENPYAHSITETGPELTLDTTKEIKSAENQVLKKRSEEQAEIDRIIEEEIAKL